MVEQEGHPVLYNRVMCAPPFPHPPRSTVWHLIPRTVITHSQQRPSILHLQLPNLVNLPTTKSSISLIPRSSRSTHPCARGSRYVTGCSRTSLSSLASTSDVSSPLASSKAFCTAFTSTPWQPRSRCPQHRRPHCNPSTTHPQSTAPLEPATPTTRTRQRKEREFLAPVPAGARLRPTTST